MKNYIPFHLHTEFSLLDSVTSYKDYVDLALKYNIKAIAFSEHGNIFEWVKKKQYCDEKGIKYIHATEIYLTESLKDKKRDNYHTILISKNLDGIKELNSLISKANDEQHFYYNPRLSFDEFLNISDNIISTSACLASPLNQLDKNNPYYKELAQKYTFYEIQPHQNSKEQKEYNLYLYNLAKKYNKKILMGTDTHSLNNYKAECRKILKVAKNIVYTDEDEFDLTFKNYDELFELCKKQNCLPLDVYQQAIDNTNLLYDMVENFELDYSFKYPKLYDNEKQKMINLIQKKYKEKIDKGIISDSDVYKKRINYEFKAFEKLKMFSFILFMSELISWCRKNGIPTGFSRGSVAGSLICYILDIIDVDPIKWDTVFSRFVNEDRVSLCDIDIDFAPEDREKVYKYIIDRFGKDKTAYITTFGTISDKGTIDEIGRALKIPLDKVAQIKLEYEQDKEKTKQKYPEIFYYFDGLLDTVISKGVHPAGIIGSPITLSDNLGIYYNNNNPVSQCSMKVVDSLNFVKYDILGLKNISIIKNTYKLINSHYLLSHEINWEDEKVWEDLITSPIGLFQFENDYAFSLLKQFKPKKINDLSIINAALRPSGESYRNDLIQRKRHKNPSKEIDDLLSKNYGFLVFQEDTIKFLTEICGFSGSEADTIRRYIGKKETEKLQKALPKILDGYCNNSNKPREIAEKEAKEFIKIISDSAAYQFGYNHSTGYSLLTYTCAYLRYYYTIEFITAYLNNAANEDDIKMGTSYAKEKGIQIKNIQFGKSRANYNFDKNTNIIYKGISTIKFCNHQIAEELYQLGKNKYNSFLDLLIDIKQKTSVNSKQLSILIKLNFFQEFAQNQKLLKFINFFNEFYNKKQIKKDKITKLNLNHSIFQKFSREIEKTYMDFQSYDFLQYVWTNLKDKPLPIQEQIKAEIEYLGYPQSTFDVAEDYIIITEIDTKYSPKITAYYLATGKEEQYKVPKKAYNHQPFKKFSILKVGLWEQRNKVKKTENGFEKIPDVYEKWLTKYYLFKE